MSKLQKNAFKNYFFFIKNGCIHTPSSLLYFDYSVNLRAHKGNLNTGSLGIFPICFQYTIWKAKEWLVSQLLNIFPCSKEKSAFVEMLWNFPIKHGGIISYHL